MHISEFVCHLLVMSEKDDCVAFSYLILNYFIFSSFIPFRHVFAHSLQMFLY